MTLFLLAPAGAITAHPSGRALFLLPDDKVPLHYPIAGEVVEGGQILTMYSQVTFNGLPEISVSGNNVDIADGSLTAQSADKTHVGNIALGDAVTIKYAVKNNKAGDLKISKLTLAGANAADFKFYFYFRDCYISRL